MNRIENERRRSPLKKGEVRRRTDEEAGAIGVLVAFDEV
jgi:hypothetical protein